MKEIVGNFWDHTPNFDLICVTTNGVVKSRAGKFYLVMGAGIARQFADRYVTLPQLLGYHVRTRGNIPRLTKFLEDCDVLSIPTKEHYNNPSTMELVLQSARIAEQMVTRFKYENVLSVRPGCGLGGLRWEDVKPVLESQGWDDRFTIISPPSL